MQRNWDSKGKMVMKDEKWQKYIKNTIKTVPQFNNTTEYNENFVEYCLKFSYCNCIIGTL